MEADGIVEGFVNSVKMHGLKFNCLIGKRILLHISKKGNEHVESFIALKRMYIKFLGDGDSSVTKRLNDRMPYGPNFPIKKIECRNHLLRNYATKLTILAINTKYSLRVRKFILANFMRFRGDVTKAVTHWKKAANISKLEKIKGNR